MIGIHIKSKKLSDLDASLKYAKSIGCSHVQLFNNNIEPTEVKNMLKKTGLRAIIHSPYVINIASSYSPNGWRTKYFVIELENAIASGADGFVVHMGKSMQLPKKIALNNMYNTLNYVNKKIGRKIKILLETTAGQGSELCYTLEELGLFFNRIRRTPKMNNLEICLDTCHIFCAGYDIRTKDSINNFIRKFDDIIGVKNIGLIHMNDSVNDIGTRKDRHTNIGSGYIGKRGLKYFYKIFAKLNVPCILETPVGNYETEIDVLQNKH